MNNDLIISILRFAAIFIPAPKPPRTDYSVLAGTTAAPKNVTETAAAPQIAPYKVERPPESAAAPQSPIHIAKTTPSASMPTTAETIKTLKQRLGNELYRVELDLQEGARIFGKPCDCLTRAKHLGALEATAQELLSYERNPAYGKILDWTSQHEGEFQPSEIAKHDKQYYRNFTPEVRDFRKEVTA